MAAEVISLGVWLDHIPLPVFSCCGWGFVVELAGREGGDGERTKERKKEGEVGKDVLRNGWRGLRDGNAGGSHQSSTSVTPVNWEDWFAWGSPLFSGRPPLSCSILLPHSS